MTSLKKTVRVIQNNLYPHVSLKHKKLFDFGIKAFSLTSFASLHSNARMIVSNRNTAHSKLYRLVSNDTIAPNFHSILQHIGLVKKSSRVNVDFSTFCGFQTLAFGVQTKSGRAVPVWADCITYPITDETSQNIFIIDQIKQLGAVLGFYPSFVFDRGFMVPSLIRFMIKHNITFYVRIKAGKKVRLSEHDTKTKTPARDVTENDAMVYAYGATLRLVRSDMPDTSTNTSAKEPEPWYILTNDSTSSREEVVSIYYYRFEIEEVFKDMKHFFTMKKFFIKTCKTFRVLMWCMIAAFWIAWLTGVVEHYLSEKTKTHVKKHLSWVRIWFEGITREMKGMVYHKVGLDGG